MADVLYILWTTFGYCGISSPTSQVVLPMLAVGSLC